MTRSTSSRARRTRLPPAERPLARRFYGHLGHLVVDVARHELRRREIHGDAGVGNVGQRHVQRNVRGQHSGERQRHWNRVRFHLGWNAQGTVTQGSLTCPFTFTNGKATQEATGGVRIVYSGTVCGIPVSGDEVLKKS